MKQRDPVEKPGPPVARRTSPAVALLEAYERPLMQYVARLVGDVESARDIVQESFLRLVQGGPDDPEHARPWLYTVARNLAFDRRRRERRANASEAGNVVPLHGRSTTPAELLEQREEQDRALSFLEELPQNQQEVVRLKFQGGLSYKEISQVTKLSVSNVGFLLHVAIKALRARMDEAQRAVEVSR